MLSIVTATYNSEKTLRATIESVLNQNINYFEYVLIDGDSKDSTVEIIESYSEKFKLKGIQYRWLSEPDKGIYDAWNKGVKMATGDWISFLGSDDVYLEDALGIYNDALNTLANKQIDLVYSNVNVVENGKTIKSINGIWTWKTFRRYMNIAHVGSFHNKKYFEKYGVFDISYAICGDYELLLRAKQNLKTFKIEKFTALMDAGGVSNNQVSKAFKETYRAKYSTAGINKSSCIIDYYLAFFKHFLRKILDEAN